MQKWVKGIEGTMTKIESDLLTLDIPAADVGEAHNSIVATPEVKETEPAPKVEEKPLVVPEIKPSREELKQRQIEQELVAALKRERDYTRAEAEAARAQAAEERNKRVEAEQREFQRTGQAIRAHGHATYSEHQQIVNAIHATKMEAESAKRDLQAAFADENLDAAERGRRVADAQERVALAAADLRTLEHGAKTLEAKLEEARYAIDSLNKAPPPKAEPEPTPPKQATPEDWISQFPKTTQEWLTEHKDYVTDPKLHRKLLRFAEEYHDEHGQLHTAEFITALNNKFFPKVEEPVVQEEPVVEEEVVVEAEPAPAPKAKVAPAAPVSRSTTPGRPSPGGNLKVTLSTDEQKHAIEMFGPGTKKNLDPQSALALYGRNKLKADRDGQYLPR